MNKKNAQLPLNEVVVLLLVVGATMLRVLFLDWKSPHFDEGINGHFVLGIWEKGFFKYDPTNFHGPLYFYYLHLVEILFGRGIFAFRIGTAAISIAIVYFTARHSRFVGRAAYWAAAIMAVSPAFVFYGRYAIHESLLILSQVLFSYGFLKWREEGTRSAVSFMVAGTMIAIATKETFFIFTGTWLIAWGLVKGFEKFAPKGLRATTPLPSPKDVGGWKSWVSVSAIGIAILLWVYSAFFMDPEGVKNMFRAFAFWTKTGTGSTGHEKPFFYWIRLLWQYEWPLLFALVVGPIAALFGSVWMRMYAAAGFGLWLAYSLIPYKTPWCLIGFWPLAFAFGFLMTETQARFRLRYLPAIGIALIAVSLFTSLRLNFRDYHNSAEPYVYVQSRGDLKQVKSIIEARVNLNPEELAMRIQVLLQDPWPLPWLFSAYPNTSYQSQNAATPLTDAEIILADAGRAQEIEPNFKKRYIKRPFQIRDAYSPGWAYFSFDTFEMFFPAPQEVVGRSSK